MRYPGAKPQVGTQAPSGLQLRLQSGALDLILAQVPWNEDQALPLWLSVGVQGWACSGFGEAVEGSGESSIHPCLRAPPEHPMMGPPGHALPDLTCGAPTDP